MSSGRISGRSMGLAKAYAGTSSRSSAVHPAWSRTELFSPSGSNPNTTKPQIAQHTMFWMRACVFLLQFSLCSLRVRHPRVASSQDRSALSKASLEVGGDLARFLLRDVPMAAVQVTICFSGRGASVGGAPGEGGGVSRASRFEGSAVVIIILGICRTVLSSFSLPTM